MKWSGYEAEGEETGEVCVCLLVPVLVVLSEDWKAAEHAGVDYSVLAKLPHSSIVRSYTRVNFKPQKSGGGDKKVNIERGVIT